MQYALCNTPISLSPSLCPLCLCGESVPLPRQGRAGEQSQCGEEGGGHQQHGGGAATQGERVSAGQAERRRRAVDGPQQRHRAASVVPLGSPQEDRQRYYHQIQEIVLADSPFISIHQDADIKVSSVAVQGYTPSFETFIGCFSRLWLKP